MFALQGPAGPKGSPGVDGAKGAQGLVGPQGPKGDAGTPGSNGVKGSQGADGAKGAQGLIGPQGPKGNAGTSGSKGDAGLTGAKGGYNGENTCVAWALSTPSPPPWKKRKWNEARAVSESILTVFFIFILTVFLNFLIISFWNVILIPNTTKRWDPSLSQKRSEQGGKPVKIDVFPSPLAKKSNCIFISWQNIFSWHATLLARFQFEKPCVSINLLYH